jgi:SAM-dependent methyltransferase
VAPPSIADLARFTDAMCAELRARFARAGFTVELVTEVESYWPGVLRPPRLPVLRWWLARRDGAGALLARLFAYDDTLTGADAAEALGTELLDALVLTGIVGKAPKGGFIAHFLFTPVEGGLWLLSDRLDGNPDAVMGPGGGTQHLGSLIPKSFGGTALDLGCGAGTLALQAARAGARRAVGVDLNPRAIAIARFNARFNGLEVELCEGDTVEPVKGQRFDLVLSQPPFVVRPRDHAGSTFLFGGSTGDEIPLRFIAAIPGVLDAGGHALVLMQSAERQEPLHTRLRGVLGDEPVDLLVLGTRGPPPPVQASVFASFEDPSFGDGYAAVTRSYLDTFEALGMFAFTGALAVIHRSREHRPGERPYTLGLKLSASHYDAASLQLFLAGLDLLERRPEMMERARLCLSSHAQVTREISQASGDIDARIVIRIQFPGIGSIWPIGADELSILAAVDGAESVGAALDACAATRSDASRETREKWLSLVRGAIVRGALVPADR